MKATGIIRNVDQLGRIVLPKELRRTYCINTDTPLEIYTDGEKIILQKYKPSELSPTQQALQILRESTYSRYIHDKIDELEKLLERTS